MPGLENRLRFLLGTETALGALVLVAGSLGAAFPIDSVALNGKYEETEKHPS